VNGIVELRQTAENDWKAKYQGNYGLYTIKITTDGKKAVKFSCSCPSDYYPCKHISIVENAIAEKIADNKKLVKCGGLKVEDLITNVPAEKLREFIITQAKYNPDLLNAVLLEFDGNCLSEMKKEKYTETYFYDHFHQLLASLALKVDPDAFIALQDKLLAEIPDKSSYEAEIILRRKIDFFRRLRKADKAWALIEENIQIKSFREDVVKNRIEKQNFPEKIFWQC